MIEHSFDSVFFLNNEFFSKYVSKYDIKCVIIIVLNFAGRIGIFECK